jgi:hypothetical protein
MAIRPNRATGLSQKCVKQHGTGQWITTISGETVSGSKTPRFTLERVENVLASLSKRIKEINEGPLGYVPPEADVTGSVASEEAVAVRESAIAAREPCEIKTLARFSLRSSKRYSRISR